MIGLLTSSEEELRRELSNILKEIKHAVDTFKKTNPPNKKILKGKKLRRYQYYDLHAISLSDDHYTVEVDDWEYAVFPIVSQQIKPLPVYQALVNGLSKAFKKFNPADLEYFAERAALLFFSNRTDGFYSPKNQINGFLKEIGDQPLRYIVDFELSGIALETETLRIAPKIYLVRSTKEDAESPIPLEYFYVSRGHFRSSLARLHVEYLEKKDYIDFHKWELLLSILRLYKVGAIRIDSHSVESEQSEHWYFNQPYYYTQHYPLFTAMLTKKDEKELPRFWRILEPHIPDSFKVTDFQSDSTAIAFQRYQEAMTHSGDEEMRIAYAISALEALFSTEKDELKYRLRMRVTRFLSILGMKSDDIYRDIGFAYDVRSKFDHGDRMDSDLRRKIRTTYNTHHDRFLTLIILDYVRISIVGFVMTKLQKHQLIKLIDQSWISNDKLKELKTALRESQKLLRLKLYKPKYVVYPYPTEKKDHCYIESS